MKRIAWLLVGLVALGGCAAKQLGPEAAQVRISKTEPGKECKFLGEATGSQGNVFTGGWTPNKNLEIGARNDLKNKAAEMGGNLVDRTET